MCKKFHIKTEPISRNHTNGNNTYTRYVYIISSKNTFGVKKVQPSKVESYLEVNT